MRRPFCHAAARATNKHHIATGVGTFKKVQLRCFMHDASFSSTFFSGQDVHLQESPQICIAALRYRADQQRLP